ncbi:CapA family protein [Paenibacillus sambharensis]|uniref:CapA family protein n=1 Tax=Paenibacillus sambharensis TaxID=1803190 RepID=A0A2W1L9L6_9BACL|nr:CapA family protein [Paenibacillus sambharensis]PZD95936.1 CapA family protein [Paenibacillus sambharensis]
MYVSRQEARSGERKRRSRRFKRLMIWNGIMLAAILVMAAVFLTTGGGLGSSGNSNTEAEASGQTAGQQGIDPAGNAGQSGGEAEQNDPPGKGPADDQQSVPPGQDKVVDGALSGNASTGDGSESSESTADGESGTDSGPALPAQDTSSPDLEVSAPQVEDDGTKVRLAFVGDILLAASVEKLMRNKGMDYPYQKALPYLQEPDLTAANLENPITTRGVPAEDKQYVFKGHPDLVPSLVDAGFDVVSLANNHTLDQGVEGLLDTIDHLRDAGLPNMGGGRNDTEAFAPAVLEAKGLSIAYFGVTRVVPVGEWKADKNRAGVAESYDSTRAVAAIKRARAEHDLIVVMVHWGEEKKDFPVDTQKRLARDYIDAGADLVIGSHPHVLQGFEQYKGKWIAYSLGNFIFNMTNTLKTRDTGVLDAVCSRSGHCELQLHPMKAENSQPAPLEGEEARKLLKWVESISFNAAIDENGRISAK